MSDFTMRRTWPDEPSRTEDFVFRFNGKDVGRCYFHRTPVGDRWHWTMYGSSAHGDAISLEFAQEEFKIAFKLHRGL